MLYLTAGGEVPRLPGLFRILSNADRTCTKLQAGISTFVGVSTTICCVGGCAAQPAASANRSSSTKTVVGELLPTACPNPPGTNAGASARKLMPDFGGGVASVKQSGVHVACCAGLTADSSFSAEKGHGVLSAKLSSNRPFSAGERPLSGENGDGAAGLRAGVASRCETAGFAAGGGCVLSLEAEATC